MHFCAVCSHVTDIPIGPPIEAPREVTLIRKLP